MKCVLPGGDLLAVVVCVWLVGSCLYSFFVCLFVCFPIVQQQRELLAKEEEARKAWIRQKYLQLLPLAKDAYGGGTIK